MAFELTWDAPEFELRDRDVSWYWISIIIAAVLIAFSVWQRDFLFGLFVVVAEVLIIVLANRTPRTLTFTLTDQAVLIGEHRRYPLNEFESFSTDESGGADDAYAELFWYFRSRLRTPILIRIPKAKLDDLRKNLRPLLKEIPYDPTLIDSLEKIIGF